MLEIPALGSLRHEDLEFEASLKLYSETLILKRKEKETVLRRTDFRHNRECHPQHIHTLTRSMGQYLQISHSHLLKVSNHRLSITNSKIQNPNRSKIRNFLMPQWKIPYHISCDRLQFKHRCTKNIV
jgi:hypothetical protein